jgi:putative transcriptional regulator
MNEPTIEPTLRRDPVAGDLLVASIMLADGVFNQSVVLILDADEDGALGVILNEISQTPLDAVLPDWVSAVSEPRMLFHGGPVSPNGAICLASVAAAGEEPPGWRRLFDTVGLLHLDTPIEIVAGAYRDLRIFAGYAGWAAGQLQSEIADLFSCGVRYCVGKRARSRSSRPGWRLPSSTERPVILSNHRPHK